jgi:hypothetical protein
VAVLFTGRRLPLFLSVLPARESALARWHKYMIVRVWRERIATSFRHPLYLSE